MKNFLNRVKRITRILQVKVAKYLYNTKFVKYVETKPDTLAWSALGFVMSWGVYIAIYFPIRIVAFFKAF